MKKRFSEDTKVSMQLLKCSLRQAVGTIVMIWIRDSLEAKNIREQQVSYDKKKPLMTIATSVQNMIPRFQFARFGT